MRKFLIIFLALYIVIIFMAFISHYAIAQKSDYAKVQEGILTSTTSDSEVFHWARTYGGLSHDEISGFQETRDGGYIMSADTLTYGAGFVDIWVLKLTSSGDVEWQRTYGGSELDAAGIQEASDGGYVVAGSTNSYGAGSLDIWVLKLTSSGDVEWQRTYGGSNRDELSGFGQTRDGGYIVAGETESFGAGGSDLWLLRLNSKGGIKWQKTYGGSKRDLGSIQQTMDGGYIATGDTESFGAGDYDGWVLKLTPKGDIEWQRTYGGSKADYLISIQQTIDGGYIAAGETESFGAGDYDLWVLKLTSSGDIEWQRTYGGSKKDWGSIQQTTDGGYITSGTTESFGAGKVDSWVLKLTRNGGIEWQKTYGGIEADWGISIQETSDGGYISPSNTGSYGHGWGWNDILLLKLSPKGCIGPDCELIGNSNAVVKDTDVSPSDTNVSPKETNVVPKSTFITPQDTYNTPKLLWEWSGYIPATPTRLKAKAISMKKIQLKWKDNSTIENGFRIERMEGKGGTWEEIKKTKSDIRQYKDKGLEANKRYKYRVRAFNDNGCSVYSYVAKARTKKK